MIDSKRKKRKLKWQKHIFRKEKMNKSRKINITECIIGKKTDKSK